MYQDNLIWLKNYFSQQSELPDDFENINYFDAGLINSLDVINLIEAIESHFKIKLRPSNFQDRRFSTIKGLAEIISNIQEEQLDVCE